MKYLAILILLSATAYAQDDQMVWDVGIGVFNSGKNSLSETKMISLGIQEDLWGSLKQRGVLGGWIDNSGRGRTGSAFISGQLGFEVDKDGTVASVFTGPALIGSPDNVLLGGPFQFMTDFHLGIQNRDLSYLGVMYRHISSAGIYPVNIGRDFVGLEIRY